MFTRFKNWRNKCKAEKRHKHGLRLCRWYGDIRAELTSRIKHDGATAVYRTTPNDWIFGCGGTIWLQGSIDGKEYCFGVKEIFTELKTDVAVDQIIKWLNENGS